MPCSLALGIRNHYDHSFVNMSVNITKGVNGVINEIGVLKIKAMPQMANKSSFLILRGLSFIEENMYIERKWSQLLRNLKGF